MINIRLSVVTVFYNPNEEIIKNITSYSNQVEKIIIVDNSDNDNSYLLNNINNIEYIPLMKNYGIAKALNIGCTKAYELGFEWCMTMDQDSMWNEIQLKNYIAKVQLKYSEDNTIKLFSPYHETKNVSSLINQIKRYLLRKNFDSYIPSDDYVIRCMCSGNIINLNTFNSIGKFYEPFFIDEVDHEYCYRLLENNYKVFQFGSILLNHHLGEEKRSFFPKLQHGIIRNYYQIRNMLYIKEKYPKYSEMFDYNKSIKKLIIKRLYCSGLHFCFYLKIILKAFHDYKNNKFGKIEF